MYDQKRSLYLLTAILVVWRLSRSTAATPTSYDQRQTGDVNVHIDVKDVQVVALLDKEFLDEYTDYNYVYDYADFTIKPVMKPTTTDNAATTQKPLATAWPTKPSTSSSSSSSSSGADAEIISSTLDSISQATVSPSSPTAEAANVSTAVTDESNITSTTAKIDATTKSEGNLETITSNHPGAIAKVTEKRCRSGTLENGNGRCRKINRRRMALLPRLALKLAPKLSGEGASKDLRVVSWMSPSS